MVTQSNLLAPPAPEAPCPLWRGPCPWGTQDAWCGWSLCTASMACTVNRATKAFLGLWEASGYHRRV